MCLCVEAETQFCPRKIRHTQRTSCVLFILRLCVCVCYYKLVLFLSLSECAGKLVWFASSHVWSDVWVAMFVMGVRSFCLFLLPISPIRLMFPLSLIHSAFCIFFIFNLGCFSLVRLHLYVCVCACNMWQPTLACGSRVHLPARTARTVCCHIDVAFLREPQLKSPSTLIHPPLPLLTQPRSAVNHKRRWLPCSLIESTFPFSSDSHRERLEGGRGSERERKGKSESFVVGTVQTHALQMKSI